MRIGSFNPVQKSGAFPDAAQRAAFALGPALCAIRAHAQSCVADTGPSNRAANGFLSPEHLAGCPCPELSKIKLGRRGTVEDPAGDRRVPWPRPLCALVSGVGLAVT
jgi:hypothetical protein